MGMRRNSARIDRGITAIVLLHLVVSFVHGAAHQGAAVSLTTAGNVFVWVVILAGPLIGLAWLWFVHARSGALIIAATMGGSLVFGLMNHFVLMGVDHVSRVDAAWRALFGSTAVMLAFIEAIGMVAGLWRTALPQWRTS